MKDLHKDIPNQTLRSEPLDLYMETDALVEYWIGDTDRAAGMVEDPYRQWFYGGPKSCLNLGIDAVVDEFRTRKYINLVKVSRSCL